MKITMWIMILLCAFNITSNAETIKSNYEATVKADSLNVRDGASVKSSVISSLKNGQKVKVLDEAFGWMQVQAQGVTGWVAGYYLTRNSESASSKKASAIGNGVRIREGPGTKYTVLSSLNRGDLLYVEESVEGWHRIRTAIGVEGWVTKEYVSHAGPSQAIKQMTVSETNGLAGKTIIVDPGHGGSDPGAIGTTYETTEKEINLTTALYLKQELSKRGAKVIMTRTTNEKKLSLSDRAALTTESDAFISVHYNSSEKNNTGTLTFYQSESKDLQLSRSIESRLSQGIGLESNGIAFGDFHVLRENTVPSTLVELGFLTNSYDEKIVRSSAYQKKAAKAIADGVVDYFNQTT